MIEEVGKHDKIKQNHVSLQLFHRDQTQITCNGSHCTVKGDNSFHITEKISFQLQNTTLKEKIYKKGVTLDWITQGKEKF